MNDNVIYIEDFLNKNPKSKKNKPKESCKNNPKKTFREIIDLAIENLKKEEKEEA